MWHAEYRLYLYPTDITKKIPTELLEKTLQNINFIDTELSRAPAHRYKVGEEFLSLICFMGCSPNIEIEPQKNSPFCYVEIATKNEANHFFCGHNIKKVSCYHCRAVQSHLAKNLLETTQDQLFKQVCYSCRATLDPTKINWRKSAFVANTWILVGNIYESEAVPDEKLLLALKQASNCEWKYAYIRIKN
jgi:hypothetical protein